MRFAIPTILSPPFIAKSMEERQKLHINGMQYSSSTAKRETSQTPSIYYFTCNYSTQKKCYMQLVRTSPLPSWPVDTTEPRKISSRHQHSTHSRTTLNGLCLVAVAVVWWSDKWKFIHQRNCNFHNRNLSNTRGYYREQEAYVHIS